jgi:NAD(P)-dependent dehydrogenase (short-subunit alcohol dehydrogenase family)
MGRIGQPCELAPAFVFLASPDSSFIRRAAVLHPPLQMLSIPNTSDRG